MLDQSRYQIPLTSFSSHYNGVNFPTTGLDETTGTTTETSGSGIRQQGQMSQKELSFPKSVYYQQYGVFSGSCREVLLAMISLELGSQVGILSVLEQLRHVVYL